MNFIGRRISNPIICELSEYNPSNNSSKIINGTDHIQFNISVLLNIDNYDDYDVERYVTQTDIVEFNGNLFVYAFGRTYILGSKYLKSVETIEPVFNNKILYEIKLSIENKNIYNNLQEKTSNSNIDKFVIREVGVYNKDNTNLNSIHQYFEPHNYYNKADGTKFSPINSDSELESGQKLCKEYIEGSSKIYNKLKHRLNPSSDMLLNNNIFLKKNNTNVLDLSGRNTKSILGEIEDYINELVDYKIDLTIYPSNVIDNSNDEPILVNTL